MKNIFNGRWLLTGAFVLIAGLAGCANSGEKTGAYVDDSWITSKVKSEMIASKHTSARNINVVTTKGVVTLSGTVNTWDELNKASEIAHGVEGVKQVENNLQVL